MPEVPTNNFFRKVLPIIFLSYTAILLSFFINKQLWQDELYTIQHFVLVPIGKTLTDYHTTNNHIVSNLLANVYLKIVGVHEMRILLQYPWIIRVLPALTALAGVLIFYHSLLRLYSLSTAAICTSVYVGCIQVFTFGAQVRGYSLQLLLCILILISVLHYIRMGSKTWLATFFFCSLVLLLNLPSTLYQYVALLITVGLRMLYLRGKGEGGLEQLWLMRLAGTGTLALMLPMAYFYFQRNEVNGLNYLSPDADWGRIGKQPFSVYYRFTNDNLVLVLLVLGAVWMRFRQRLGWEFFMPLLLTLPFVLYCLYAPTIILRIWLPLLPVFALWAGLFMQPFFFRYRLSVILFVLWQIVYCGFSIYLLSQQQLALNQTTKWTLDLRYQYHLFNYNPWEITKLAKRQEPVLLFDNAQAGITYYLEAAGVRWLTPADSLPAKVFIIANHRSQIQQQLGKTYDIADSGRFNNRFFYKHYIARRKP